MYKLSKKQKKILIILIALITIMAYYFIYLKNNQYENILTDEELRIEEDAADEKISQNEENEKKADRIIVHVSGAVNNEGIVNLSEDSRVINAIEEAGGFKEDAYTKDINLAYKVEDGMKIYIPYITEKEESNTVIIGQDFEKQDSINLQENKKIKININKATQTELETLPGIGPSTALKIISYRKENGNFKDIQEIKNVNGIGEAKYENIKEFIII